MGTTNQGKGPIRRRALKKAAWLSSERKPPETRRMNGSDVEKLGAVRELKEKGWSKYTNA